MPFTMCHEIGHRMAFARENEANFAAFLACSVSEREVFRYSGYYSAFIYCYNALYRADPEAALEVWSDASAGLKVDAAAARAHYDEVENEKVSKATYQIYDSYLKAFSVASGKQSYGEVVDLLTAPEENFRRPAYIYAYMFSSFSASTGLSLRILLTA